MYFNRGVRNFARLPTDITLRYNWEFYTVTSGKAAPFFSESEKLEPSTSMLWLFPPRRQYSWWSATRKAERIVFHFSTVNESLRLLVGKQDYLQVRLDRGKLARLKRLADEIEPFYQELKLVSSLHFDRALAELSLMVAESCQAPEEIITMGTKNQIAARRALAFYESQLPRRPVIEEVAQTVGVSATHLRRIFLEVFHNSPKHVFLMAQLDQAKRLAADSDLLISDIAKRSGFVGAPHLCHAFQKCNQITFNKWRTQLASIRCRPHLRRQAFTHELAPSPVSSANPPPKISA